MTSAPCDDYRLMRRTVLQCVQYGLQRQIVVGHHIGYFIQQHHVKCGVGQHSFGVLPDGQTGCGIGFAVLGVPRKAGRHHLKLNAVRLKQITLAVRPLTFNKLDNADLLTVADGACRRAECGRGFPFAVAGKDDDDPALILSGRDARINLFLQTLLALLMPGLRAARMRARMVAVHSDLRQITLALDAYALSCQDRVPPTRVACGTDVNYQLPIELAQERFRAAGEVSKAAAVDMGSFTRRLYAALHAHATPCAAAT